MIAFELDDRAERFWIVVESVGCSVCDSDPGFDVDVTVRAPLATLYRIWYNQQTISSAIKQDELRFDGHPALVRRMPKVLDLSRPDLLGVDAASARPVWRSTASHL